MTTNRYDILAAYNRFCREPTPEFIVGEARYKLHIFKNKKRHQIDKFFQYDSNLNKVLNRSTISYGEWKIYIKLIHKWLIPTKLFKSQKLKLQGTLNDNTKIYAIIRYDDECGNGYNSFSITADIPEYGMFGCCHNEFAEAFPEYAHLLKWHLCGADGPLHYITNTMYHIQENEPTHAWLYESEYELIGGLKSPERCIAYTKISKAHKAIDLNPNHNLFIKIDERTKKVADIKAAQKCAVALNATLEQLSDSEWLLSRLVNLLSEFRYDLEQIGFTF